MRKLLFVLIGLIILTFSGCTKKATGDEKTAEDFVKSKGYTITAGKGEVQKYVLDKSKLCGGTETISYQQAWGGKLKSLINILVKKYPYMSLQ
jgi:hypothetical protein